VGDSPRSIVCATTATDEMAKAQTKTKKLFLAFPKLTSRPRAKLLGIWKPTPLS